jgi:asparagine synthase (glutamine-hydrolysing)
MVRSMEHESFYQSGTYFVPEMGIYAGWVALASSFASGQPIVHRQEDVALIFAGECFRDPQSPVLQSDDSRAGYDADWLVSLYEKEGAQFVEKLNGLFSGLLIDKGRRQAFLFNDRYGLERIYLCETADGIYFASEAKALLRVLKETRTFDERGVAQFLNFGCTLEWQTLFSGVQLLPGGSLWSFAGGRPNKGRYFLPGDWESQPALSPEEFESRFQETFRKILPRYFESHSSIGISLTGGLDTRMIMACRPASRVKPVCYTFSGEKVQTLDARLAARVAKASGLEHRNLNIGADFFSNFATYADRTVHITDGCFGVLGAHEIYFNQKARQLAAERLTGNFGSEILRGMSTFKPIGLSRQLLTPEFSRAVDASAVELLRDAAPPVTFAAFREIPWNLFGSLAAGRSQVTFRTPYLDNELVALAFQAPEALRKSPLVALRLVKNNNRLLSKIPTDRGYGWERAGLTYAARRLWSEVTFKLDYIYSEGLPHQLAPFDTLIGGLSKTGVLGLHKYLPYRRWFRRELATYVQEILTDPQTRRMPFWNSDFLQRMAADHVNGRKNYVREINAVLTLEAAERLIIRGTWSENPVGAGSTL